MNPFLGFMYFFTIIFAVVFLAYLGISLLLFRDLQVSLGGAVGCGFGTAIVNALRLAKE